VRNKNDARAHGGTKGPSNIHASGQVKTLFFFFVFYDQYVSGAVRDRWHRTPLHWALLNRHEEAALFVGRHFQLELGAIPEAKHAKRTHLQQETPRQIAQRVYGEQVPEALRVLLG